MNKKKEEQEDLLQVKDNNVHRDGEYRKLMHKSREDKRKEWDGGVGDVGGVGKGGRELESEEEEGRGKEEGRRSKEALSTTTTTTTY